MHLQDLQPRPAPGRGAPAFPQVSPFGWELRSVSGRDELKEQGKVQRMAS